MPKKYNVYDKDLNKIKDKLEELKEDWISPDIIHQKVSEIQFLLNNKIYPLTDNMAFLDDYNNRVNTAQEIALSTALIDNKERISPHFGLPSDDLHRAFKEMAGRITGNAATDIIIYNLLGIAPVFWQCYKAHIGEK